MRTLRTSVVPTSSTTGAMDAIAATKTRVRRDMSRTTSSVTKTWMTTVTGARILTMGMYGTRTLLRAGLLIAMATGPGSIPGDGLGSMMSLGATPRFITAAGCRSKAAGAGSQARWKLRPCMPPHSWSLWVVAGWRLETTWLGSRWARVKFTFLLTR